MMGKLNKNRKLLGDVLKLDKDSKIDIQDEQSYKVSGVQNYGKGVVIRKEVLGKTLTMKQYQIIKKNQLMWCKVDTKNGAFGITKDEHVGSLASTNMALANIDTTKIMPEFLETLFCIPSFHEHITKYSSGSTNRKYLTPVQLFELIEIPDLDIEEQKSFLKRLNSIKLSGFEAEIEKQLDIIKKLRQSILQEAIEGKLTAKWREENQAVEPASVLLEKIKAEKEKLVKEGKIKKEKPLPEIKADEIPFDIPESWSWCRTNDICHSISSGSTPSQDCFKKSEGIPYLKVYNIKNQEVNFDFKPQYITEQIHKSLLKRSVLYPNDVVMNIVGPPLGKIALVPDVYPEWNCNQAIAYFKLINKDIAKYLYYFLRELSFLRYIHFKGVAGQDNISVTQSKSILLSLPPVEEQKIIVQKIENLFAMCNELEEKIKASKSSTEALTAAILKEAFQ